MVVVVVEVEWNCVAFYSETTGTKNITVVAGQIVDSILLRSLHDVHLAYT